MPLKLPRDPGQVREIPLIADIEKHNAPDPEQVRDVIDRLIEIGRDVGDIFGVGLERMHD